MNELARTPEIIATEINTIKDQTRRMMLYNSIEIGRRLTEAKELVPHGEWGDWLERSVNYSKSTANNLMRIFQEYGSEQITLLEDNAKSEAYARLSYSQAVALLGIPEAEREAFIAENDVENMSTRELQQALKERDEAKKRAEEAEKEREKLEKSLEDKQNKAEMFQKTIEDLKKQLTEAQSSGKNEEVKTLQKAIKALDEELSKTKAREAELEKQLKEKPVEATVVEKIPEEVERELEELRKKVNSNVDKAVDKFKANFEIVKTGFNGLFEALAEIQDKEKYKEAAIKFLNILIDKVKEMS